MRYSYQAEKLSSARSALMLPHSRGEAQSIADAFHELSLAFHKLNVSALSSEALHWVKQLEAYMDTTGITNTDGEGAWTAKARSFTTDDQLQISRTVDELAHWFAHEDGM
jgi:hypothetical protein